MKKSVHAWSKIGLGLVAASLTLVTLSVTRANDDEHDDRHENESRVQRGFAIAPVPLNLQGKKRALVGLGSYIVNAQGGCNDCHTHPNYAPGGDPFLQQPEQINASQYLTGGRQFGPFTSKNLTPDTTGRPAGLTLDEFKSLLRTGHDPDAAPGTVLQVMPWPVYGKMIDRDLTAIYEFLRAIPSRQNNPNPGQ